MHFARKFRAADGMYVKFIVTLPAYGRAVISSHKEGIEKLKCGKEASFPCRERESRESAPAILAVQLFFLIFRPAERRFAAPERCNGRRILGTIAAGGPPRREKEKEREREA